MLRLKFDMSEEQTHARTRPSLLQTRELNDCVQVAAIGFCMGGALAVAASQYHKICAAVACYGLPPAALCVVSRALHNINAGDAV